MSAHGCPRCGAICGCSSTGCAHRCPPTSKPGGLHDHIVKQRNDLVDENDRLADENAALRKSQAADVAELRRADETIGALRKRVEELEISAGSAAMTIRLAQARAEKAEAQLQEAELRYAREFATRVDFQERAEKAERELAKTKLEWARSVGAAAATRKAFQADLDMALEWIVTVGAPTSTSTRARVLALLEKRRVERG